MSIVRFGLISRIALLVIGIEIAAFGLLGWFYVHRYSAAADEHIRSRLQLVAQMLATDELAVSAISRKELVSGLVGAPYLSGLVIGGNGRVIVATDAAHLGRSVSEIPGINPAWFEASGAEQFIVAGAGTLTGVSHIRGASGGSRVFDTVITISTAELDAQKRSIVIWGELGSLLFILLSSAGIVLVAQRLIARRVAASLAVLKAVEEGLLEARIAVPIDDEIGQLQHGINSMTEKVGALLHQHRRNEADLQKQSDLLQSVVENAPVRVFWKDAESRYLGCNSAFARDAGLSSAEEIVGMTDFDFAWKAQAELYRAKDKAVMQSGAATLDFEEPLTTAGGKTIWRSASKVPLRGPDRQFIGVLGIYSDITERKRQEERTRQLLAENETILNNVRAGIAYLRQRKIISCNRRLEEIFRYEPGELIGESSERLYDSRETFDRIGVTAYESVAKGESYSTEVKLRHKNGTLFWGMLSGRAIDPAHPNDGSIWVYSDITEQKAAEADLRIAAAAFESQESMMITDADNVILRVNQAFTGITGYTAAEAVGNTPHMLSSGRHPPEFYRDMWDSINRTGAWNGEVWNRRKNGDIYPIWLTISAVRSTDGSVTHYVGSHIDITERKAAEEKINELAFFDPLTGLPNRRLLLDRLHQALASSTRSKRHGALLFADLDNFKTLNDTKGHDVGDLLLQQVAQRLVSCVREGDTVARLGGDEFVLMLEDLSDDEQEAATQTEAVGEKILAVLNQPYQLAGAEHRSTPSIGIALFADHQGTMDELLKRADLAMYQAKAAGRNTLRFFDPEMQAVVMTRAALEADMREAILKGQFVLHYQAQIVGEGRLTGAEVLVRWQHPQRGLVSPAEFIPLAEDTGLILPLGQWVLETACAQLAAWTHRPELAHLTIAVNVSTRQFNTPDFVEQVLAVLDRSGANPQLLKLELTESLLAHNVEDIIVKMNALKQRGIGFSLDDFGTGYSSLSYLKRLPLDQLKIDQGFVRHILSDPNDAAIAKMVVALAESMGLAVIAEGVELSAQRDFLALQGCHAYQGYLFSRPLPAAEFEAFARKHAT